MREEELLRIRQIVKDQTALIQKLRSELRMARGAASTDDPIEKLLGIALEPEGLAPVRIEAAALVLQHAAAEGQIATATAVLAELAGRADVPPDLRVDALRALAKRQVAKAPPAEATADRAAQARLARALMKARARLAHGLEVAPSAYRKIDALADEEVLAER